MIAGLGLLASRIIIPDAPCRYYLPTFTPYKTQNVDRYSIHGEEGYHLFNAMILKPRRVKLVRPTFPAGNYIFRSQDEGFSLVLPCSSHVPKIPHSVHLQNPHLPKVGFSWERCFDASLDGLAKHRDFGTLSPEVSRVATGPEKYPLQLGKKKGVYKEGLVHAFLFEHHPNIGDLISNRYLKVVFKIFKMGHLPNPITGPIKPY